MLSSKPFIAKMLAYKNLCLGGKYFKIYVARTHPSSKCSYTFYWLIPQSSEYPFIYDIPFSSQWALDTFLGDWEVKLKTFNLKIEVHILNLIYQITKT